jgi:glycosyl transferase family 25
VATAGYSMKTFLINLDRNPERLHHMARLLLRAGLTYERIAAIDGKTLTDAETISASPALSRGEIGCLLSHRLAWRMIADGPDPYGAVLEDDIHLSPDLAKFLSGWNWIPGDADVVKLETSGNRVFVAHDHRAIHAGHRLIRLGSTHPGTAAYVISAGTARRMLERTASIARPVDAVLFELPDGEASGLVVYQVDPALCIQDDFLRGAKTPGLRSTIQDDRRAIRRSRGRFRRIGNGLLAPVAALRRRLVQGLHLGPPGLDWRVIPMDAARPERREILPGTHHTAAQNAVDAT